MADAHDTLARAGEVLENARASRLVGREVDHHRRTARIGRRLTNIAIADGGILFVAAMIGMAHPLGLFGALFVMLALIAVTVTLAVWPGEATAPPPERLRTVDLAQLPAQTGRWLAAQRPALPAPAVTLADRIGQRLDQLAPQLARLDADAPIAGEVRQLVAEQLPDFVGGYTRVPAGLRTVPRNGKTPDAQLVDGLGVIDRQLADLSAQLAQGDLDTLATRGRYLEIKYRGDEAG